jgi:hypothetical protein
MSFIRRDRYVSGTANALSDLSGFKYKRKDMRKTWDNYLVGADEWEPKHPQLVLRPRAEKFYTPDPRPDNNGNAVAGPPFTYSDYV